MALPLAVTLRAEAQPERLEWELVGEPFDLFGIFSDAQRSRIYAVGRAGLFYIQPNDNVWTLAAPHSDLLLHDRDVFASGSGALFVVRAGIARSTDDGDTWEEVLDNGQLAPVYTPAGALVTNRDGVGPSVARSTDDGQTWALVDLEESLGYDLFPITFAALPATDALPGGRLVAGGNGGLIASADDGLTWAETDLTGPFRVTSAVRAPWDTALPNGGVDAGRGTLYAVANALQPGGLTGEVWESVDGARWERVGRVPGVGGTGGQLLAVRGAEDDGGETEVLYAIAVSEYVQEVYASGDRGRTWASTGAFPAEEMVGNPLRIRELAASPEGRLWLAFSDGQPGPKGTGGVFRTAEAVVTVAAAEAPPEGGPSRPSVELGTPHPNPSGGAVVLPLTLGAVAEVRVAIYDVLGREVAVLHDGPLAAGSHRLGFDGDLPTGVYLVRAVGDGFRAAQRVTVVR